MYGVRRSVIDRMPLPPFTTLLGRRRGRVAVMVGSVTWIIDAAWGWHPLGWMVRLWGYHDAYASGVVHAIAGGGALAFLIVLGPRLGKFRPDGTPRDIPPHNVWLVVIGLFLIYTGFWGFYAACNIPIFDVQAGDGVFFSATNIYLQATTLSAITPLGDGTGRISREEPRLSGGGLAPGVIGPVPATLLPFAFFLTALVGGWYLLPRFRSALLSIPLAALIDAARLARSVPASPLVGDRVR